MKTNILPLIAFLAALGAILLVPVGAVAAAFAFTVTGVLSLLAADYGHTLEPLKARAEVVPFAPQACEPAHLRTAA